MVTVSKLGKHFNGKLALSEISFQVAEGEVYGLIGPNGAGKTTTFRIVAGLMRPDSGTVNVGPTLDIDPLTLRKRVGYLTGATGLYPRLLVRELLEYFGLLYRMPKESIGPRTEALAQALGFTHLLERRCEHLSTGEKQRVSIARAMFHDPMVLILDEPTAGLDVLASRVALHAIRQASQRGCAVLFSTHYLSEADLLCDRVGLIHQGHLVYEGTPSQVRAHTGTTTLEEAFLKLMDQGQA